ncbi:hypothetical protein [Simkania sp.]|uniref:hypothetical protein n=1 Tax=Simkania sp. TaxID=34094 RepID=UPI003B521AF8
MDIQVPCSQLHLTKFAHVRSYPADLEDSIQKISNHFPHLLEEISQKVGEAIKIILVVDLPVDPAKGVMISSLQERDVTVVDAGTGYVSLEDLSMQNILIGQETSPAYWSWEKRVVFIAQFEGYGKYDLLSQSDHQVLNLLFEMHNALQTPEVLKLNEKGRELGREKYVRACEDVELSSVIKTSDCLEKMIHQKKFHSGMNFFKTLYRDSELNYLFQQLSGHSFAIARDYDKRFPCPSAAPYQGTWATPFNRENQDHVRVCEQLRAILKGHMRAVSLGDETQLKQAIEETANAFDFEDELIEMVQVNLKHFQKKYGEYVEREKPARVINIPCLTF